MTEKEKAVFKAGQAFDVYESAKLIYDLCLMGHFDSAKAQLSKYALDVETTQKTANTLPDETD